MLLTQTFNLDIVKPPLNRLRLVSGDTANRFVITITENGSAVSLDTTLHKIIAVFTRADGEVYTQDASCGVTFTTLGVVTIDLRPASFRTGTNKITLQIYKRENSSATEYPLLLTTQEQTFNARAAAIPEAGAPNAPSQLPMLELYALLAKSWAVGGTGRREGEDTDNSKFYSDAAREALEQQVVTPSITAWLNTNRDHFDDELSDDVSDWLEENITPTTPAIDASLTVSGAGADAKVTGKLRDKVASLEINETVAALDTWTQGGINEAVGGSTVNAKVCRNRAGLITSDTELILFNGYDAKLFFYTSNTYSTESYDRDSTTNWLIGSTEGYKADLSPYIGKYMTVCVRFADSSAITPSDVTGVRIVKFGMTDTSLTLTKKAADAKATGDRVKALEDLTGKIVSGSFVKTGSANATLNMAFPIVSGKSISIWWELEGIGTPMNSANFYVRATSSGPNIETLAMSVHPDEVINVTPTENGSYLRVSATASGTVYAVYTDTLVGAEMTLTEAAKDIPKVPFVQFGFESRMYDPSTIFATGGEMGSISGWTSPADAITHVYDAFDALIGSEGAGYQYGELIYSQDSETKLYKEDESDTALFDLLAPDYVTEGVTQGQTVTLNIGTDSSNNPVTYSYTYESDTDPYESRLYRFKDTNNALTKGARNIPKKKLLIVGGVHGNEFCAPINLYVFAKQLCTDYSNPDIIKLRSSYDIYIIPYLNGFGCQYQWTLNGATVTGSRCNGNLVDINRNCPTKGWKGYNGTSAEITTRFESAIANLALDTFPGPSNGSEFEGKLLKAIIDYFQPDVFIDHHHNSGNCPFYSTSPSDTAGNLIYQAANDCAYTFTKNMPTYYGDGYAIPLILGTDVSPVTRTASNGHTASMSFEEGVEMSGICEMSQSISCLGGVYDADTKASTKYSSDAFKVSVYTLLSVTLHLCQYAMEH